MSNSLVRLETGITEWTLPVWRIAITYERSGVEDREIEHSRSVRLFRDQRIKKRIQSVIFVRTSGGIIPQRMFGDGRDVRIHQSERFPECEAEAGSCGIRANSGERLQRPQIVRNGSIMSEFNRLGQGFQRLSLLIPEPERFYDLEYLLTGRLVNGSRIRESVMESLVHLCDLRRVSTLKEYLRNDDRPWIPGAAPREIAM
jgi:hypothetical protein